MKAYRLVKLRRQLWDTLVHRPRPCSFCAPEKWYQEVSYAERGA